MLQLDDAEHERRCAAGLSVATGHGFGGLNVLMALAPARPARSDLGPHRSSACLRRAPAGICTLTREHVVRHVTRPCRVSLATVRARSASTPALDAVSEFAPFCARRVINTRAPSLRIPEQLLEFGFYGIGVCLQHADGDLEMLVEPRPWRPKRPHTTDCWWFAETAYARFLKQSPTDPSGLSLTPSRPDLCN